MDNLLLFLNFLIPLVILLATPTIIYNGFMVFHKMGSYWLLKSVLKYRVMRASLVSVLIRIL